MSLRSQWVSPNYCPRIVGWQQDSHLDNQTAVFTEEMGRYPVLSSAGQLVVLTLHETTGLSLPVPVIQLMKLFPKVLDQLSLGETTL